MLLAHRSEGFSGYNFIMMLILVQVVIAWNNDPPGPPFQRIAYCETDVNGTPYPPPLPIQSITILDFDTMTVLRNSDKTLNVTVSTTLVSATHISVQCAIS